VTADPEMDFEHMSLEEVALLGRRARKKADTARKEQLAIAGRSCAHLHAHGWTWEQIGKFMEVNLSTAYRWARPYLPR
jgi:hypothetical protein